MSFPVSSIKLALTYAREELARDPRVGVNGAVGFACRRIETQKANAHDLADEVLRVIDRARDRFALQAAIELLPGEQG